MAQKKPEPPEYLVELFGDISEKIMKGHEQLSLLEEDLGNLPDPKEFQKLSARDVIEIGAAAKSPGSNELLTEAIGKLVHFLKVSRELQEDLAPFVADYARAFRVEQDKQSISRKNERTHLWKLWFEKLVRWSLGALAAVFLYSFVVCLSDKYEFFKVPVHHTMTEVVKSPLQD